MNRRGFLKGLFGGATAGGILIATSDVGSFTETFKTDEPLIVDPADAIIRPNQEIGNYLYDAEGNRVALITGIEYELPTQMMSSMMDTNERFVQAGPATCKIEAIGLAGLRWRAKPDDPISDQNPLYTLSVANTPEMKFVSDRPFHGRQWSSKKL